MSAAETGLNTYEHAALDWRSAQRELARRHLSDFIQYTKEDYVVGVFNKKLCNALDVFLAACVAKKSPRMIVVAPPRHGKSEVVSRRFPPFALGRHPWMQFIGASYNATLVRRMSRDVQRIMDEPSYLDVFPESALPGQGRKNRRGKVRQAELVELLNHDGAYRAAGVGEGITGGGANVLSMDDLIKGAKEANSDATREATWEWYLQDARTRLEPGGGILLTMTRWHMDDPVGRILESLESNPSERKRWKILHFAAIAEEDEGWRSKGQPLHPERWPLRELRATRKTLGGKDGYVWTAMYQGRPNVKGGSVFKGDWWKYYKEIPPLRYRKIYGDTASKTRTRNDFSVFQSWGAGRERGIYLLDQIRGKWEAPLLKRKAIAFWLKHKPVAKFGPRLRNMNIEDKSSGTGLIQEIRTDGKIPIREIQRGIDKVTRAMDGAPSIESGLVYLPDPDYFEVEWLNDFLMEFEQFTMEDTHKFDDQIDPTLDAIQDMLLEAGLDYASAVRRK